MGFAVALRTWSCDSDPASQNTMRFLIIVAIAFGIILFYFMTAIVYFEGSFDGAFVVKPYPMREVVVGGGEAGLWARHNPGHPPPWFMQDDLQVVFNFDWESGYPAWIGAYILGYLATHLTWVALVFIGAGKLVSARARINLTSLSIR